MLHRRRTPAQCLWLYGTPHSTLVGCRYTLELSRDPQFPEVSTAPGFPLQPSYVAIRSSAVVCGRRCALSVRPVGGTLYPLSLATRSSGHFLPDAVSWSPNLVILLPVADWSFLCNRSGRAIGSNEGVTPPSAQRSRTSPIRGMRLQRLLGWGLAILNLLDRRSSAAFRPVCLQLAFCPKHPPRPGGYFGQNAAACARRRFSSPARLCPVWYSECRHFCVEHQYV